MARYDIRYSCGHSGRVNLIGPLRSRESRITYLESGECFECYKQRTTSAAHEQSEALELPVLVGTEKQIAWAETLRLEKLNEIEAFVERHTQDKAYRQILVAVESISNETSAKQWIEWRYDGPEYLLSRVLQRMLSAPSAEQLQAEQQAREQVLATQRAAQNEATLRPENVISEIVCEIIIEGSVISAVFPERRDDFKEIVKSFGCTWSNGCWQRTINKFAGSVIDRTVELACILLSSGFAIRSFDSDLRNKIVAGVFEPEQTRWITKRVSGPYAGWFAVQWGKHEDYYHAARRLEGSRYSAPCVVVPSVEFQQVLDFAQLYDFKTSTGAQELIAQAHAEKQHILTVTVKPVAKHEKRPMTGDVPPVLVVPDDVEVAEELRDSQK